MAPRLVPTRNQLVTAPVIRIFRSARLILLGKSEATDTPMRIVAIQTAAVESSQIRTTAQAAKHPKRSIKIMVLGLIRVDTGMAINLPKVSAPQYVELRYAAMVSFAMPRFNEYVYIHPP